MPEYVKDRTSVYMSGGMPDEISESMSDRIKGYISDRMPKFSPDRMFQSMPDRLLEYLQNARRYARQIVRISACIRLEYI